MAAHRLAEACFLQKAGPHRYTIHSLLLDFAAGKLAEDGGADTEGAWVDRLDSCPIKDGRWFRVAVPRPSGATRPFTWSWVKEGLTEFRDMFAVRFWPAIRRRRQDAKLPAEAWAIVRRLHRRGRSGLLRYCLLLAGATAGLYLLWIFYMAIIVGLIDVRRLARLPEWQLNLLIAVVSAVILGPITVAGWGSTIGQIDEHRIYHMSPGEWRELLEKKAESENVADGPVGGSKGDSASS
jgi:hypothetical protein